MPPAPSGTASTKQTAADRAADLERQFQEPEHHERNSTKCRNCKMWNSLILSVKTFVIQANSNPKSTIPTTTDTVR